MSDHRVLLLTDYLEIGGLERIVVDIANYLGGSGFKCGVGAVEGGHLWSELDGSVERRCAPPSKAHNGLIDVLRYVLWLRSEVRNGHWSIVHAHQRGVALRARIATFGLRCKVVEHVHNVFPDEHFLKRFISFRGDLLVACGPVVVEMLVNTYGRRAQNIRLVTNAVKDIGEGLDLTLPCVSDPSSIRIVGVGRISKQKNVKRFVDIVHDIQKLGISVSAVWVGDGEERTQVDTHAKKIGATAIDFAGWSDEVESFILSSDVLLLTSNWEGLPLVILEAMALGRSIIATDVGSVRFAVQEGLNGVLLSVDGSPNEDIAKIRSLLTVTALTVMGQESRRRFVAKFSQEVMMKQMMGVYDAVV